MEEFKTFSITFNSIDDLKYCFGLSADLDENSIINFSINNEGLIGIAKNSAESCYKYWELHFTEDFKNDSNIERTIKCSLYKGKDFISKILKHFDKSEKTKLTFSYDEFSSNVRTIRLEILNENNKKSSLVFNLVTAKPEIHFDDFDSELIDVLFNEKSESIKITHKFDLSNEEIKQLKTLCGYVSNDELQKDYLSFKFNDNELSISDDLFTRNYDVKQVEIVENTTENFDLSKSLFNILSKCDYEVVIKKFDDSLIITFISKDKINDKTTFLLLKQIDMSVNYEDIFNETNTYE